MSVDWIITLQFVLVRAHNFMMIITDANECADGREYTDEFRAGRDVTDRPTLSIPGRHVSVMR